MRFVHSHVGCLLLWKASEKSGKRCDEHEVNTCMTSKTHDNPHPCLWRVLRLSHLLCRLRKRGHVKATEQPRPNNDHVYTLERDKYRFVDFTPRVPGPDLNSLVNAQTRVMRHAHARENDKHRFWSYPINLGMAALSGVPSGAPSGAPSCDTLKKQALLRPKKKGFGNQNAPTVSPKPAAPVTTPLLWLRNPKMVLFTSKPWSFDVFPDGVIDVLGCRRLTWSGLRCLVCYVLFVWTDLLYNPVAHEVMRARV